MGEFLYKNQYMNRLVRHIEANLPFDLDTGMLSRAGCISHAQLYRDFYNLTGHSVKEYIRKRRLSNALALIKASDFPLADIAHQCGYSSQQALCRAVKQTLGMTPLGYKNSETYYFYPPYHGEPVPSVMIANETLPEMVCLPFYHSSIKDIENKAIHSFLTLNPDYSGRLFGRNGKQYGNLFCYELYLTDAALKTDGFLPSKTTEPLTSIFASSIVKNDEDQINTAWNYLYHIWLQKSMFEYSKEPYYEEYILRGGNPVKLKLYLPIKKRTDETKITLVNNTGLCFITAKAKGYHAEKTASKMVVDYLSEHYPYILRTSKEFYLHREMSYCVCGIRVNTELPVKDNNSIENMMIEKGCYLVLESSVMGDYEQYSDLLLSFASDNGMIADRKDFFAVYDAKDSFDKPAIRMYCPIKVDTK